MATRNDDEDEYEESLIYVDLDDIPSVDELFAVEPDDFLTCQSKKQREIPQPKKAMHPQLLLKFYNLDSSSPVLQIGSRYYSGDYEEAIGSCLMFQDKSGGQNVPDPSIPSSSRSQTVPNLSQKKKPTMPVRLKSLVSELRPPPDKIYGEKLCSTKHPEFTLVANVNKVLKMKRTEINYHGDKTIELPETASGEPAPVPGKSYPIRDMLTGKHHGDKNSHSS